MIVQKIHFVLVINALQHFIVKKGIGQNVLSLQIFVMVNPVINQIINVIKMKIA